MTHELKIWPEFFESIEEGLKTFEIRKNDKNFKVGDVLKLREWVPVSKLMGYYTGREMKVNVTYILPGGQFGIQKDYVVMGISNGYDIRST